MGSDDRQNWFALKEYFLLSSINSTNSTSEVKIVDFPLSNYTYYILKINDSTSAPLNILKAGYYEVLSEDGKYTEIATSILKTDSAKEKMSYIRIQFDTTRVVDKVVLSMTGSPYFLRKATIQQKKERKKKKGKEIYYEVLSTFTISSKQSAVIELPGIKANELLISVENADNPSLEVSSLKVFQLNRYLTAWLKKDEVYKLKIGGTDIQAPDYDLGFFEDNIPDQTRILTSGPVTIYPEIGEPGSPTIFTSRVIIWGAIILVIIVLGFMAVKMINETSLENRKE